MQGSAIVGIGMYVPKYRIRTAEIAKHWGEDVAGMVSGLGVQEKSVPDIDEDSFTMAYEAAGQALSTSGIAPGRVSAIFVGSESHPYAVKPTSGMLVSALSLDP